MLEELKQRAQKQKYLLMDDLLAAIPDLEDNLEQVEELYAYLIKHNLKVYATAEEAQASQTETKPAGGNGQTEGNSGRVDPADLSEISAEDILSLYFKEMAHVPLLSFEEEVRLAKQIEKGRHAQETLNKINLDSSQAATLRRMVREGEEARNHLVQANTRLVVSIAKKYLGHGVPLIDLIQEGNLGLMRAIAKFDHHLGFKFSTYATWWIRQAVSRALSSQGRTIRIPIHMGSRFRRLKKAAQELEQTLGRKPTPQELGDELNLEAAQVRWMLQIRQRSISLDQPIGPEADAQLGDFIEDEDSPRPYDLAQNNLLREELEEALASLPAREARILKLRFGLHNGRTYSLSELGEKFGLTRERIRQLEKQALRRLRHPRRSRQLREYLS